MAHVPLVDLGRLQIPYMIGLCFLPIVAALSLEMVFEVCRMAGWLEPPTEAIHVSFGSVLGDDRNVAATYLEGVRA